MTTILPLQFKIDRYIIIIIIINLLPKLNFYGTFQFPYK